MTKTRVVFVMVEKRAPKKHQEALKRVLKKQGFDAKGSFIYVTEDGEQVFELQGVPGAAAEQICHEVLASINTATQKKK